MTITYSDFSTAAALILVLAGGLCFSYIILLMIFRRKWRKKKNFYINGNSAFIDWIRCNYRVKIYNKIGEKNGKKNNWQHKI